MVAGVMILSASSSLFAGFWSKLQPYQGPHKDIITLVITGNYSKPRLLADLVQNENKQPYLLIPGSVGGECYFVPSATDPLKISDENFTKFVKMLNPKQIIIIGDTKYVSDYYLGKIDKTQTFIRINNKDWVEVAKSLGKILDLPNLADDYERLLKELESGKLYKTKGAPAGAVEQPPPVVEPAPAPAPTPAPAEPVIIKDTEEIPLK